MPYDYPSWSGLGVAVIPDRAFGDVTRSAPVNIADTLQLPTAIISPIVATASAPTPSQVVTGTPGANMPLNAWGAPCAPLPAYCSPILLGGAALAILLLAPGQMKLAAAIPAALFFVGPCLVNTGCPGTAD